MAQSFSTFSGKPDPQTSGNLPLLGPSPVFRSPKDRQLAAFGASPDVNFPDGYLGTITNRRQDKLQTAVTRATQRQYSRGVHKGERINPGDYMWPDGFNLQSGLVNQTTGMRWAPPGLGSDTPHLVNDGKVGPRGVPQNMERPNNEVVDTQRREMLKSLVPSWR